MLSLHFSVPPPTSWYWLATQNSPLPPILGTATLRSIVAYTSPTDLATITIQQVFELEQIVFLFLRFLFCWYTVTKRKNNTWSSVSNSSFILLLLENLLLEVCPKNWSNKIQCILGVYILNFSVTVVVLWSWYFQSSLDPSIFKHKVRVLHLVLVT